MEEAPELEIVHNPFPDSVSGPVVMPGSPLQQPIKCQSGAWDDSQASE